ncbi:ELWxxDGT repeat protein [Lacibacter sediminis]|uniref:DUF1565 domain-containing protein n=1 Tax=Lacibacter sediminis TaxID=2760713 RepID=A0A7G5XGG4_9BACT|nr:ELWxxDGT repeat protein [Lacibacter sediminis]QNA44567.1 DUF1565 domain-containing protein [Lacibacter sediminis]
MKKVVFSILMLCTYVAAISQNPILLKDVSPGNNSGTIQQIVKTSNYTFFNENDGGAATDRSLYRTDGTPAGTLKLNLTYPGYISTKAEKLTALGNKIIFAGDNSANYGEVWISDGTQSGTVALERFQPNSNRIPVVEINAMDSYAYYSVINKDASNVNHAYLKRTDGTAAGTSLVYDFSAFTGVPQVVFLTPVNNILYFIVYDQFGTGADQLWRSDGTTAGTYMVYDFTTAAFVEGFIMPAGNVFYILIGSVVSGVRQNTLWKSDGTAAGTAPLKLIGTGNNYIYPAFASIGSTLYFAGQDGNGRELWKTDGTEVGTVRLADINPGAASANPINFTVFNNALYFSANNGTNGTELWKYNGTVAAMVEDILPGSGSSSPSFLVESNGTILFQATNGITGNELWITDGTAANTKLVADINIAGSSLPNLLTTGNPVYFAANDGVNGFEVFKYDNSGGIQNIKTKLYVNDNSTAGDVFTTAIGNNENAGTAAAPYASLQYAVSQAAPGAVIYVDAGAFSEQVIIDKGISIIGAGATLTFFTPPASSLVPAPGPFTEIGLFETTQNIGDVHISGLSLNSNNASQNIIIQSGGSVKNCSLLNGGQGIFFRIESATKTAVIENNFIQPQGIGINCQGAGLTALIKNNTITNTTEFYSGIFAGLDFGPLPSLTVTNNILNNYASYGIGISGASYNGTINQNSFTGAGVAINRNGNGGNTLLASCNWFGSSDAGTVASKIIGTVNYTPFLTSGIDGSSNVGFQPTATCPAGNTWYVNNNNLSGDLFTTAVGNNANAGTKTAPFATIQYAVNIAATNDIIYVDAGTYTEQVTITKGITIIGAGQNLTFILKPTTTAPPPGPFTEQGVIQTSQNIGDVNIKDLSVTGDYNINVTPLIIQTGGSVRNCKLQNGNQGLFVRIDPATNPTSKTFVIEGNTIDAEYIAVNVAGTNLSATLNNNTLTANNTGFSSGLWAGMDFGPLGRLTATNNLFNKYVTSGIQISASNASITQNAFIGTGTLAINRTGGANITANCNWYGTTNPTSITTKVNAGVTYYPWFTDGTDASSQPGFQHNETCGASSNIYYVNDNSTSGDLFTTAVGNDANAGTTPTSPLATINAALTKASPGATIYIDAGTYSAQNTTIGKQVQIIGTNYNASPNNPSDPLLINPVRNAESIIDNSTWTIGADGISITGLTFTPTGNAVVVNNTSFGGITLNRNRAKLNSIFPAFVFLGSGTGTSISSLVNWGLTINENRFEKEDASSGNSVRVNRFGNVNINNNSFVVTGSTERTQNSIAIGNAGVVAYLFVNNNIFDRAAIALNTNSLGFTNINKNIFSNTGSAFVGNNSFAESSDVLFTNNTLDGSGGIVPFVQYTRQGGNAVGATSSFTVEGNSITGTAIAGTTTLLGSMNLIFMNSVLNPSLTVRNNKISYSGDLSSVPAHLIRPIMLRGNLLNAVVEKNEITLTGTNQQPKTAGIDLPVSPAITLHPDNGNNSFLQTGSVINIRNNKVHGFKHSFVVFDNSTGANPYVGFGNLPFGATVNVNNNSFTGDSMSINHSNVGEVVNASCNWYGSAAAQEFINKLSLPTVDIAPWLTNGTDNDAATGFQPVPNSCDGYPTLITLNGSTNVTCNGAANGTINITTSYGKVPFTYTWTKEGDANFVSHDEDPTGLASGTYHLAILDGNGSNIYITDPEADGPGTITITITEPDVLTASAGGSNNVCFNGTIGTASVLPAGGTASYTYLWSNGATANEITNLAAGVYNVTVTDAKGCTTTASYEVTQPTQVIASITNTSTACSNIATVAAGGGTKGYTYLWSNGSTSPTISGVPVGTYNVTVTDANGCTATASVTLTVAEAFNPSASVTNVTCFGANNGIITVTNANGTGQLMFSKDGGVSFVNGSLPFSFTNLAPGTYNIAVKDVNGCTGFVEKTIAQPTVLTATIGSVQSTCFGTSTGAINITVSGGTPSYSYSWTGLGGSFSSSQLNISSLAAGDYTLTVRDNNNCTYSLPVTVPSIAAILVSETINNVTCRGAANGSITVNASGGTNYPPPSFNYLWNTGATTTTISNLAPGNYSVRITDNGSGCFINKSYTVTQPALVLALTTTKTNATGCNSLGTITATGSGGTAPYTYTVNGNVINESSIGGLYAGDYTVTVTDANGCTTSKIVTITDNGSDEYEGNNSKNQAKQIPTSGSLTARLALANDAADWFRFTAPVSASGLYSIKTMTTAPNVAYAINVYASGNNTPAIVPVNVINNGEKHYQLTAGTTYFVSITTATLSFICYNLTVSALEPVEITANTPQSRITVEATPVIDMLKAFTYPNPHNGNFTLSIESPEEGVATVEMYTVNGQKLSERKANVTKGKGNTVKYSNMNYAILFYKVRIGKHVATGKIISPN